MKQLRLRQLKLGHSMHAPMLTQGEVSGNRYQADSLAHVDARYIPGECGNAATTYQLWHASTQRAEHCRSCTPLHRHILQLVVRHTQATKSKRSSALTHMQ
jgi:hypothetical protein